MKPLVTLRKALGDPLLLADALKGDSWHVWRILLIASVGEWLTEEERAVFKSVTGRDIEPGRMIDTWLTVSGRRSGKTTAMAALVVWLSCLCDWSEDLSLGERGTALYLAPTQDQASRAYRYAREFIHHSKPMRKLIANETADRIELSNGIDLEIQAANWRSVRGVTCVSVVLDECAFLRNEADSANSDQDLITALRPSLVTTNGPMLLISSPGTEAGVVWSIHRGHYGPQGDAAILVVQANSKSLNPRLDQTRIDREFSLDPEASQAEWGGQFRAPTSIYLSRALVERAVSTGVEQRPRDPQFNYVAFNDSSGGEGKDSFTWAIAHRQYRDTPIVVDAAHEIRPPFNSEAAVKACAESLRAYNVRSIVGDAYAKGWPRPMFAKYGIEYVETAPPKSDLYLHCIPLFTSNMVELIDNPRLVSQLCQLRRKIGQGGRESVDHLRNGHDDVANSVCGVLWRLSPVYDNAGIVAPIIVTAPTAYAYEGALADSATSAADYLSAFRN